MIELELQKPSSLEKKKLSWRHTIFLLGGVFVSDKSRKQNTVFYSNDRKALCDGLFTLPLLSLALFRRSPNFFFRMFQSLCSYAQRKIGSKQLRSERKGSRRRRLRQSSAWTSFQSSRDQYPEKFSAFCFVQNLFWRCFAAAVVIRETAITATTLLLLGETVTANST